MREQGIIEFKSFEEKVRVMRDDTDKKYKLLQARIKELRYGFSIKEAECEAKK